MILLAIIIWQSNNRLQIRGVARPKSSALQK
jgi:hypothetical protein